MQRRGFTLVELLIVIAILAVLASMVLFALAGAEGTAKEMNTRTTIEKLNVLIMRKYESYRTRRVPVRSFQQEPFSDFNNNGVMDSGEFNPATHDLNQNGIYDRYRMVGVVQFRLTALRELMRMEMPDRLTDLQDGATTASVIGHPTAKMQAPASWLSYRRALAGLTPTNQYQGAECLYLIVSRGLDDPEVMEQFSGDVGDKDGDGLKEFWDAWDNPISFLRWAPGFDSDLQNTVSPITEHDPFDPMQAHFPTNSSDPWYLPPPNRGKHPPIFPLIYSAGPDGVYDIVTDSSTSPIRYAFPPAMTPPIPPNNPYYFDGTERVGTPSDLDGSGAIDSIDNITNHDVAVGPGS